jgi:type I restriction enzyme M protein
MSMLSSELKSDIRKLWDAFWSGGMANPLTAIEQITYLVFLKELEDLDNALVNEAIQRRGQPYVSIFVNHEDCRWSQIKQLPNERRLDHMQSIVFPWMRIIASQSSHEHMKDAVFMIQSINLLNKSIEIIDSLFIPSYNQDTLGDIYEYLLSEIALAGKNGQFRTPRHIIRMMIELIDPKVNERIADPSSGTAGFLVNAYQYILMNNTSKNILRFESHGTPIDASGDLLSEVQREVLISDSLYGWDFDQTMVRLGWMNMIQHGLRKPNISYADTLGSQFNNRLTINGGNIGDFDVVLANPPFAGNIYESDIGESLRWINNNKTELLFVELIIQLLRDNGRTAVIVPEGVLFGSTKAHIALRKKIVNENELKAIISLPNGVFQPYAGIKTSILVFTKGGRTKRVWFYEIAADGFSQDAKRADYPEENDIWDLIIKFRLKHGMPRPAFLDEDIWREWSSLEREAIDHSYFQPILNRLEYGEDQSLSNESLLLKSVSRKADYLIDKEPKQWEIALDTIESNGWDLSAGRYKPFTMPDVKYDSPAQIIRELKTLESQIHNGLETLLSLLEENEHS